MTGLTRVSRTWARRTGTAVSLHDATRATDTDSYFHHIHSNTLVWHEMLSEQREEKKRARKQVG